MTEIYPAAANQAGYGEPKKTGAMQELGKDAFLQLLVTQLRYQDPLNPQDNGAFIAQMAQFTALEQMQSLNATVVELLKLQEGQLQVPALLDRLVTVIDQDGEAYSGKVQAIEYSGMKPLLVINGLRFGLEALLQVTGGEQSEL